MKVILGILEGQNVRLSTSQLKLISRADRKNNQGKDFRFAVDQGSLAKLEVMGGVVTVGLDYIKFRFAKRLRVVQINLHHCEAASIELGILLVKRQIDVALIQEPWLVLVHFLNI